MGASGEKIKIVVILENDSEEDKKTMEEVWHDQRFEVSLYVGFEEFLEKQSLKQLSYIIIREGRQNNLDEILDNRALYTKNQLELRGIFDPTHKKLVTMSVRQKLTAYIKRYFLDKLLVYLLVDDIYDIHIPDYQATYITLVSQRMRTILEHIATAPKKQEISNVKFRRLVKDLYRRITVIVIDQNLGNQKKSQIDIDQWKQVFKQRGISYEFESSADDFGKKLLSVYCEYIVVNNVDHLTQIVDCIKQNKIVTKVIYKGKDVELILKSERSKDVKCDKSKDVWLVRESIVDIGEIIRKCSDVGFDQSPIRSRNTIIYYKSELSVQDRSTFLNGLTQALIQHYSSKCSQNEWEKKLKWIYELNLKVLTDKEEIMREVTKEIYSFLITVDCNDKEIEELKGEVKANKFLTRVYMYSISLKDFEKIQRDKTKSKLQGIIDFIVENCQFKIKFEVAPVDSIATYRVKPEIVSFFQDKMGFKVQNIQNENQFERQFTVDSDGCRQFIIQSEHIVCRADDYIMLNWLLKKKQGNQQSDFKRIKVIIYDDKPQLQKFFRDRIQAKTKQGSSFKDRIVFMHFMRNKIQDYISNLLVAKLAASMFIKKALPNFYDSYRHLQKSQVKQVSLHAKIVNKNKALKDIFKDNTFEMSISFEVSLKKISCSNRDFEQESKFFEEDYIGKYATLWHIRSQFIANNNNNSECIRSLKEDLIDCFFKCRTYELITLTEEEFKYFYIDKIKICADYLDLQIACIYIYTLPNGIAEIVGEIFKSPLQSLLTLKVFALYIVVLLSAFCSFQDQVMQKQKLFVELSDPRVKKMFQSVALNDIIYNTGLIRCGIDHHSSQNHDVDCMVFQFQNIPFLISSRIKNYLFIERFSFYKQSSQYLIAPYTKFKLKSKTIDQKGKCVFHLVAANCQNRFISKIFKINDINQGTLYEAIRKDIIRDDIEVDIAEEKRQYFENNKSMYRKADIIGLEQEKNLLAKSIEEGVLYKQFLGCVSKEKFISAASYLAEKQNTQKLTTDKRAKYYINMLGVEKSFLAYNMSQFSYAISKLDNILGYLAQQRIHAEQDWVFNKIKSMKECIKETAEKRAKKFMQAEMTKQWRVEPVMDGEKVVFRLGESECNWEVKVYPNSQYFYLRSLDIEKVKKDNRVNENKVMKKVQAKKQDKTKVLIPCYTITHFGESTATFSQQELYQVVYLQDKNDNDRNQNVGHELKMNDKIEKKEKKDRHSKQIKHKVQSVVDKVEKDKSEEPVWQLIEQSVKQLAKQPAKQPQKQPLQLIVSEIVEEYIEALPVQEPKKQTIRKPIQQSTIKEQLQQALAVKQVSTVKQALAVQQTLAVKQTSTVKQAQSLVVQVKPVTTQSNIFTVLQTKLGIKQHIEWQVFYFQNKFTLVRKNMRFKAWKNPPRKQKESQIKF